MIWTIPKLLRAYFRYNRKLLGKLSRCSYLALRDYYREVLEEEDAVPGFIAVSQSADNSINPHSHCHSISTEGAMRPDGTFPLLLILLLVASPALRVADRHAISYRAFHGPCVQDAPCGEKDRQGHDPSHPLLATSGIQCRRVHHVSRRGPGNR